MHRASACLVMALSTEQKIMSHLQLLNVIGYGCCKPSTHTNGLASFPGPHHPQSLINCSMQIWEGEGPGDVTGSFMAIDRCQLDRRY